MNCHFMENPLVFHSEQRLDFDPLDCALCTMPVANWSKWNVGSDYSSIPLNDSLGELAGA